MFEIDSPSTWSTGLRNVLKSIEYQDRVWFNTEEINAFAYEVEDREIQAFHASRLTSQEIENIQHSGLEFTTADLVCRKLQHVRKENLITDNDYRYLLEISTNTLAPDEHRVNQICLSLGKLDYIRDKSKLANFWRTWGGEIINMNVIDAELLKKLKTIGKPVNVTIHIPDFVETGIAEKVLLGCLKALHNEFELIGLHIPAEKTKSFKVVEVAQVSSFP